MTRTPRALPDEDYRRLLTFRSDLREFMRWSEDAARKTGLTPALHQLLLVVRGHPTHDGPTIGDVAAELQVRHHSAVELASVPRPPDCSVATETPPITGSSGFV
jgi:hypothetical protein